MASFLRIGTGNPSNAGECMSIRSSLLLVIVGFFGAMASGSVITNTTDFPTPGGVYETAANMPPVTFGNGPVAIYHWSLTPPPPRSSIALPAPGSSVLEDNYPFDGDLVFSDQRTGSSQLEIHKPIFSGTQAEVTNTSSASNLGPFAIVVDSLVMSGGDLPPGMILRESPTLDSTGTETVTDLGKGQFQISSFFDVFTELSLDGGQTWTPASGPLELTLTSVPEPASVGFVIFIAAVARGRRRLSHS
jgi:hypothetical protein